MAKTTPFVLLFLFAVIITHSQFSNCPAANPLLIASGTYPLYTDSLTVSSDGAIGLLPGSDIQCYNYTLTTAFNCSPSVAICSDALMQPWTTSPAPPATTSSSPSRPSVPTAFRWFPSSSGRTGHTPDGPRLPSPFWLKHQHNLMPDTIRLTLRLCQRASLEKKSPPLSPSKAPPLNLLRP